MRVKRILAIILTALTLTSMVAIPVMAGTRTETFHIYMNGGSKVSSGSAQKSSDGGGMYYDVRENSGTSISWVQGVEVVNLRGRTSGGIKCTDLAQRATRGSGIMNYYSGYGIKGNYYKIALQYDSDNPYEQLELQCNWIP